MAVDLNDKFLYIFGQLSLTGMLFIFSMVLAYLLDPKQMGLWNTALLISSYAPLLQLGIINGLGRELPYNLGKGEKKDVQIMIENTTFVVILLSFIFILIVPLMKYIYKNDYTFIFIIILLSIAKINNALSIIILRSYQDYLRLGIHQVISMIILMLFMVIIYNQASLVWVATGMVLSLLLPITLSLKYWSFHFPQFRSIENLIKIGFPIYAVGLVFSLLSTTDRWLILTFINTEALGLYTPSIIALGTIIIVPSLVSNIMYPKLAYAFGNSHSIADLRPIVFRMILLNLSLTSLVTLICFLCMNYWIIPTYLPKYLAGREAMSILFIAGLILPIGQSFGDFFNVINKQKIYLRNMMLAFIINVSIGGYLITYLGLKGVAIGSLVGFFIFTLMQVTSYKNILSKEGI